MRYRNKPVVDKDFISFMQFRSLVPVEIEPTKSLLRAFRRGLEMEERLFKCERAELERLKAKFAAPGQQHTEGDA